MNKNKMWIGCVRMKIELEKMIVGEMYDFSDREFVYGRNCVCKFCREINDVMDLEFCVSVLKCLFGGIKENVYVEFDFCVDYGFNIYVGENFYVNFDCVILDVCEVYIGDNCMMVFGVYIYMVMYLFDLVECNSGLEFGKLVEIGDNVWIGGWVIINLGVKFGNNVVVVLGVVVMKSFFDNVVFVGNLVCVIKIIEVEEK